MAIHLLYDDGDYTVHELTVDPNGGDGPQVIVPAGVWQAALALGDRYALCGCTVAPGFDFTDFEFPSRDELVARYPQHRALIESLARM